jgi:3-(3-hydroxy-phenyl)propionate hydroxylase
MDRFRHGRVFFVGDAAHGVSPFGARGANGGVQDAENLAWKLAWVLQGKAPDRLLDSYDAERLAATDENILNSTRSTDFITPKSAVSRLFRDATLSLAKRHAFARTLVNSGRLSLPCTYRASMLNSADGSDFTGTMVPGAPCVDAPVHSAGRPTWLLDWLGRGFVFLYAVGNEGLGPFEALRIAQLETLAREMPELELIEARLEGWNRTALIAGARVLEDRDQLLAGRYDLRAGTYYLIRPDQHVCARGRQIVASEARVAVARACAMSESLVS